MYNIWLLVNPIYEHQFQFKVMI